MDTQNPVLSSATDTLSRHLMAPLEDCNLCDSPGGETLWEDSFCRIVRVADADYPGFCRVILNTHAREMTDLDEADRLRLMRVVFAVEDTLRAVYHPDKINLACFGNVVPHLHWHIIPRWHDDRHFPQPVWGTPQRVGSPPRLLVSNHCLASEIFARLG